MTNQDLWDQADNPVIRSFEWYGQVQANIWAGVLEKGTGKVPFEPDKHSLDRKVTVIDVAIETLPEQNNKFPVSRSLVAETKAWAGIVLPSIKKLGMTPRELHGKWVHVKPTPTGRTYEKDGATKDETTFEFVEVFPDEQSCRAAYNAAIGNGHNTQAAAPVTTDNGNKEKATALQFLKVIVENACRGQSDLTVIRESITINVAAMGGIVAKYFTVDSTETLQLISQYLK